MDDAAAHEPVPEAVGDRAREAAVVRVRHQRRELLAAASPSARPASIVPSSGKRNFGPAVLPVGLSQRCISQRLVGDDRGQAVGVVELPASR